MRSTYSVWDAAVYVNQLPDKSRVLTAIHPQNAWSMMDYLLADIANTNRLNVWSKTKGAEHGTGMPDMFEPPKEKSDEKDSYTTDEIDEILRRPRVAIKEEGE